MADTNAAHDEAPNANKSQSDTLPQISLEGYKLLAQNLQRGDVVDFSYVNNGEVREATGVIAKANRGGIRIIRPDDTRYPLVVVNCSGGNVYEKKGNGSTDHKRDLGSNGRVIRTGETASVDTTRAGRVYTTDYSTDD